MPPSADKKKPTDWWALLLLQNQSGTDGYAGPASDGERFGVEGDLLVLPAGGVIARDHSELLSQGPREDHLARCFGKLENVFFHRFASRVEIFLGDVFDGDGGSSFEITATGKTAVVKF
ncbi:MAG: hypothetical protein SVT56_08190 [Chloroflexota bacterium]|nr:hypothetical protein [Chloroflexota bacterium]